MMKSRKLQLIMFLVLTCIYASVLGAEPNEPKTELKFEISDEKQAWFSSSGRPPGKGPIKPSHVAEFFIMGQNFSTSFVGSEGITMVSKDWDFPDTEGIKRMLQTSAGRSTTQKQHEFLATSDAFVDMGYGNKVRNYREYRLYAVSEMDAKRMVEAFLEILAEKGGALMQECKKRLQNTQERISHIKKILPEKQVQAKSAESKYKEVKNARYSSLREDEADEKAKETMLQMGKMLDVLEIELAGIREKLGAIEGYRSSKRLPDKRLSDETVDKLDQMFVEQMIELRSAEARKQAALRIHTREKAFLDFSDRWANLEVEVDGLRRSLSDSESDLRRLEGMLANPRPEMLPPKVFQNKVTIYPVRVGD